MKNAERRLERLEKATAADNEVLHPTNEPFVVVEFVGEFGEVIETMSVFAEPADP